ncbi:heat shock 70 kDa protein-like protein [Leptotrombidium deliense]|uniref:Heat shock 70 kDa protein-like protein n=1 Tax=Leptotrombidium deliense TaxID=299467 RepID=A0A443S0M2_9ACAR|nr:heat shock 70 kDa protein-like protein [Leptotrombidium deliense]
MSVIIPRNSPYPNKLSRTYRTLYDNQKNILIQVYQGEREMIADNHFLGDFKIDNLPKKKAGKVSVEETMEIDENGLLVVTAVEKSTGVTANITISNAMERLSDEKIKQLLTEAESVKKADLKEKQRIEAKNELEKLIYDIRRSVDEDNSLRQRHKRRLENVVEQMQEWVELNSDASEEEFNIKINELKRQQNLLSITTTAFDIGFKFFESFLFKK